MQKHTIKIQSFREWIIEDINDHKSQHHNKELYQSPEDEEDHEEASECGFRVNIPIANSGHGDHEQVDTFPVRKRLVVLEIFPWVP